MTDIVLFEDECFVDLLPLVYWRSIFELRLGRHSVLDRMARQLQRPVKGIWTRDWMKKVAAERCGVPAKDSVEPGSVLINGRWLFNGPLEFPTGPCVGTLDDDIAFIVCDRALSNRLKPEDLLDPSRRGAALERIKRMPATGRLLRYPWDIISHLGELLHAEWHADDATIETKVDQGVINGRTDSIHIGERARIHPTTVLDPAHGPIYISDEVSIGPYSVIEGPAYIGPGTILNPHTWLHGGNAIGPGCKIGGEIDGCTIAGHTNKQHTGFLGHSYVGSWVNIGAGCANSDLKNTYGKIRVPINGTEIDTGVQFFGAIIGDHAKIGINASIPTGAVIGLGSTIQTNKMLPKYVPSFSWVSEDGISPGDPARLLALARVVMARRNFKMTDAEAELFTKLPTLARQFEAPL